MNKNRVALTFVFCLLIALTAIAQLEKKPMTNTDVLSMLEAGLSESTIVMAIQQSQPNFDTSPQALIQLKNKGASSKVLDSILQFQAGKSLTTEKQQNLGNSNERAVLKTSVYDFNFELISCITSGGDSLLCTFSVINKANTDRKLRLRYSSRIIDDSGKEYTVVERTIGKENETSWYRDAETILIPEVRILGTVKFERFSTSARKIKALRLSCRDADKEFNVDFLDILINGRNSSLSADQLSNSSSRDLIYGMSLYERGNPEQSFEPLSRAIANGEKAMISVYHRINGPGFGLDDDMYPGHLHITKDTFEFRSVGSVRSLSGMQRIPYTNFKIPMNKIVSVKVEPRKQGRLSLELLIADEKGKEKKKTYNFYPQTAELLNTGKSGPYWEIRCADCEQRSEVLAKLLQKLMVEATAVK